MSRPSDGMTMDELRDEFDWTYGFMGNMAERIRGDADVHNLADYVRKLESENAKLREDITRLEQANIVLDSDNCDLRNDMKDMQFFIAENRKLRELVLRLWDAALHPATFGDGTSLRQAMRDLGIEVDA